mmetsp:Transcript_14915/g.29423  ORF Transcript_14915/g.29423 Transcript_14915/m.29423 type:complete len:210 (-) Transcript_14915:221-850(-)
MQAGSSALTPTLAIDAMQANRSLAKKSDRALDMVEEHGLHSSSSFPDLSSSAQGFLGLQLLASDFRRPFAIKLFPDGQDAGEDGASDERAGLHTSGDAWSLACIRRCHCRNCLLCCFDCCCCCFCCFCSCFLLSVLGSTSVPEVCIAFWKRSSNPTVHSTKISSPVATSTMRPVIASSVCLSPSQLAVLCCCSVSYLPRDACKEASRDS